MAPERSAGSDGLRELAFITALLLTFLTIGLWVYGPSLGGAFLSDDIHYVVDNPYIDDFDTEKLLAILDPRSPVVPMVENYAPVHLLGHLLERQFFGLEPRGYHIVNVALHALASLLLVLLFERSGASRVAAVLGGLILLVHPANVEAVAWISQLKSPAALVLTAGALLLHPRRPLLGAVFFALAMLAKPMAWLALPTVLAVGFMRRSGAKDGSTNVAENWRWGWLGLWVAIFATYSAVELTAYSNWAMPSAETSDDSWAHVRSSFAIAGHYLVLAVSGWGTSSFHDPPSAVEWLDPWWIGSLVALLLIGWRIMSCLQARRLEFAWWVWAGAAYAPFCGLIPLPHMMADRYLYFVLPGVVGAGLLAAQSAAPALAEVLEGWGSSEGLARRLPSRVTAAAAVGLSLILATQSLQRAAIWTSEERVLADSVLHYPDGAVATHLKNVATLQQSESALRAGDSAGAVEALWTLHRGDFDQIDMLLSFPPFAPLREQPRFKDLLAEMAAGLLEKYAGKDTLAQHELQQIGLAHFVRGELDAAERALERALELGGPNDDDVRQYLLNVRAQRFRKR